MHLARTLHLLRSTRRLTIATVLLLLVQLFGKLYEEVVTNVATIADPAAHVEVGAAQAGSPLFFYLPWVPIGLGLASVLAVRLHREAPASVGRRARWAMSSLALALAAKVLLITRLNPQLRRTDLSAERVRELGVQWALGNGVAIVGVALAVYLFTSWRPRALDAAAASTPSKLEGDVHSLV